VETGKRGLTRKASAEKVAFMRALGSLERDPVLRNPDFVSRDLLADIAAARLALRLATRVAAVQIGIRETFERTMPGSYWGETARVKHFDEVLLQEVSAGVPQVVILGAGLDSRPYRFARELNGTRVFEVDHPVTASHKRERLQAVFGGPPAGVSYVSVDLAEAMPGEALAKAGFDASAPVFVLWVGVTLYLPAALVAVVLDWVATHRAGSSVAFDYIDRSFFAHDGRFAGSRLSRFLIERSGERLLSGFDPSAMPALLEDHGLALRSHVGPRELERYLRKRDGEVAGQPSGFSHFVHAEVLSR
jgi:methyltransferase (TIGR00027 family)